MKFLFQFCLIAYAICQYDLEKAYEFLMNNKGELLQGQWTKSQDHLIFVNIAFDNQNLVLQVYPQKYNKLHKKHDFKISYILTNSSYQFNPAENLMIWNNVSVNVQLKDGAARPFMSCVANLYVEVSEFQNSKTIILNSRFNETCPVNEERIKLFIFSAETYQTQVESYTLLIMIVCLIQIIASIQYLNSNPKMNLGASLTISIIITQDIYVCAFSSLLFDLPSVTYFAPTLMCQLISILYDLKLKAKLSRRDGGRKTLIITVIEVLITTTLLAHVRHSLELILLNLYLVPQILYTFFTGQRQKYNKFYLMIVLPRSLIGVYTRGCPYNILQLLVRPQNVYTIFFVCLLQGLVYYYQTKRGCFLLKDNQYNYYVKQQKEHSVIDCPICLISLSQDENLQNQDENNESYFNNNIEKRTLMQTPCVILYNKYKNHIFHSNCLSTWMQISLTCPLCKQEIPEIL